MYGRLLQFAPTCAIVDFAELGVNCTIRKQLSKLSTSDLTLCCQVLRCPPVLIGLALFRLAISTPDVWCGVVMSCYIRSRDFSVPDR